FITIPLPPCSVLIPYTTLCRSKWFSYIMYFNDIIKIELTLIPLMVLDDYLTNSDGLDEILIDKDNRINEKIVPRDKKYWIKKPSEREFDDCCNEFWNVSAYVAKGLLRKELDRKSTRLNARHVTI